VNDELKNEGRPSVEDQLKARLALFVVAESNQTEATWLEKKLAGTFGRHVVGDSIHRPQVSCLQAEVTELMKHLSEQQKTDFGREAWEQCVTYALSTPPGDAVIDDREKNALFQVASWLDLPNDEARRRILGLAASRLRPVRDDELQHSVRPPGIPTVACVDWAARWDEDMSREIFDLACKVQETHEQMWDAGKGRLDGIDSFHELTLPDAPYCDSGVMVLPENYQEKEIFFVGDLHGDIGALDRALDLVQFFSADGREGPCLLFLGDYGDRGLTTLAVWMRVIWLKAQYPERVFMLRGNHEDMLEARIRLTDYDQDLPAMGLPVTRYWDTFAALYHILEGVVGNILMFCEYLPSIAVLPDGMFAVHGGVLPRRRDGDGWKGSADDLKHLQIDGLTDLRKPRVQLLMRWADPVDEDDMDLCWSAYQGKVGARLTSSKADFLQFSEKTGLDRFVVGHGHPEEGHRSLYGGKGMMLDTSRATTGNALAIGRHIPGKGVEPIRFTI
jgi:hypothetical protein